MINYKSHHFEEVEFSMAPIDKFELAIIEFGVKEALEYFGTPESIHHLWNERWEKNVISKTTGEQ